MTAPDTPYAPYAPSCSISALHARAQLYQRIRVFFAAADVLEVETPLLASTGATDTHLASITALRHIAGRAERHYLQTSPEFAMKRLLASGSGAIYQICKVFRDDEHGRRHNSEFSMLEWYVPAMSLQGLMAQVQALLSVCLDRDVAVKQLSYKHAFVQALGVNPLTASVQMLKDKAQALGLTLDLGDERMAYVDLLFSHAVEPALGTGADAGVAVFLTDFPPELASLAKVHYDDDGQLVASRFELYMNGLELANAYDELTCADVLRARFYADNDERTHLGLPTMPIDERLLSALPQMPECVGIALGLDRLLMVALGAERLADVVAFTAEGA